MLETCRCIWSCQILPEVDTVIVVTAWGAGCCITAEIRQSTKYGKCFKSQTPMPHTKIPRQTTDSAILPNVKTNV